MTFSRETPLSELLKYNKISKRVYNVLTFRKIHTLGHLMEMFDRKRSYINTFSKRVASEIRELQKIIPSLLYSPDVSEKSPIITSHVHPSPTIEKKDSFVIYKKTSIEYLHHLGFLTQRTLAALFDANIRTAEDLMRYKRNGWFNRHHFSYAVLADIDIFLDYLKNEKIIYVSQEKKKESDTSFSYDTSRTLHPETYVSEREAKMYRRLYAEMAYDNVIRLNGWVIDFLRELFPNSKVMEDEILSGRYNVLTIYPELGKDGNLTLRNVILHYLHVVKKYIEKGISNNYRILMSVQGILTSVNGAIFEFRQHLSSFTDLELEQYFLTQKQRDNLSSLFNQLANKLSNDAKAFQQTEIPTYYDAIPLLGKPEALIAERYGFRLSVSVIHEIWMLVQAWEDAFREDVESLRDMRMITRINRFFCHFPFSVRRFIFLHQRENDYLPLFYVTYNYVKYSKDKNFKVYALVHGFYDGQMRALEEVGNIENLSRERIRQIYFKSIKIIGQEIERLISKEQYRSLLNAGYITEFSPKYRMIQEEEGLPKNFQLFCSLLAVLGDFETIIIGSRYVSIQKRLLGHIYVKQIKNHLKNLYQKKYSKDTLFDLHTLVESVPNELQEDAFGIVCLVAQEFPDIPFDENWRVLIKRNHVNVSDETYMILKSMKRPMSLNEIFTIFKQKYPEHKYDTPEKLKNALLKHKHVRSIGMSGKYALDSWSGIYFGNIRDLLRETLYKSSSPIHISKLTAIIQKYFPDTNTKSISSSMAQDTATDFVVFEEGYYGLASKKYPAKYIVAESAKKYTFEERLEMLVNFIKSYHRFPYASGGDLEQSLQRWLYNVEHEAAISLEQKTVLSNTLQPYRDAHLPENSLEEDCAEMCEKIKEFIQREYELPTRQSNIELYEWLSRSKANYNSYIDNRRYYLTELFNYIHSLGFTL